MIKEETNIDFYTTGRQPSEQEFKRISELIKKDKEEMPLHKSKGLRKRSISPNKSTTASRASAIQHQI